MISFPIQPTNSWNMAGVGAIYEEVRALKASLQTWTPGVCFEFCYGCRCHLNSHRDIIVWNANLSKGSMDAV